MTVVGDTPSEALLQKRIASIDTSGWGRRFAFYQPRNLAFWVYLLLVGVGMAMYALDLTTYDSTSVASAAIVFVAYGTFFWWLTQRADRYTEVPVKLMIVALLWGAFAATWAMAANANGAIGDLYAKQFGQTWSLNWGDGLSAPITEELAKGAGLLLLIALAPRIVRTAFDGFILGLLIGLGFQTLEDMSYALRDAPDMGTTIMLRMVTGLTGHFAYTAIFCAGLVYFLGRPAEPRNIKRGILLMVAAPILHGLWDSSTTIARGNFTAVIITWLIVMALTLLIFVRVFALTVPRERELLRDVLAPEVAAGIVTDAELSAMVGNRKARRAYRRINRKDKRRARNLLEAAYDLADELAKSRGSESEHVQFARAEVIRIRNRTPSPW